MTDDVFIWLSHAWAALPWFALVAVIAWPWEAGE